MVKRKAEHAIGIGLEVSSLEPGSRPAKPPIHSEPTASPPIPTSLTNLQRVPNVDVDGSGPDVASHGVGSTEPERVPTGPVGLDRSLGPTINEETNGVADVDPDQVDVANLFWVMLELAGYEVWGP